MYRFGISLLKFQTGDTIYIYSASPECSIKYKVEVIGHDMLFVTKIECQRKYMKNSKIFDKYVIHNRFALLKLVVQTVYHMPI